MMMVTPENERTHKLYQAAHGTLLPRQTSIDKLTGLFPDILHFLHHSTPRLRAVVIVVVETEPDLP